MRICNIEVDSINLRELHECKYCKFAVGKNGCSRRINNQRRVKACGWFSWISENTKNRVLNKYEEENYSHIIPNALTYEEQMEQLYRLTQINDE